MCVLLYILIIVIDIAMIIMSAYEIFDGDNSFGNILTITLGTLSLMLLFYSIFLEMT